MITLAQLEQEVARRTGPFYKLFTDRQVPNTAQFTYAMYPELRSVIDLDSVTNLWLLRRGVDWQSNPVVFDIVDRQRIVASYDPENGRVYPDRPWGQIPVPGEVCEFHHLNPEQELRVAVLAGLRRCFFEDVFAATLTSQNGDIDLTYQQPWIASPDQVIGVGYGLYKPWAHAPFHAYRQQGHVMLGGTSGAYAPSNLWVTALRPAWSWVNDADSTGPTDDDDELAVDLDYAASAAHIEAWHHFPARMQSAAANNLQATQEMAAREFTRQSLIYGPAPVQRLGFMEVVSLPLMGRAGR